MKAMFVAITTGLLAGTFMFSTESTGRQDESEKSPAIEAAAAETADAEVKADQPSRTTTDVEADTGDIELSADEAAIRRNAAAFVDAYEDGDAKALAALFATDAECVHESDVCCSGREAIEESLTDFFKQNPGCKLMKNIDSIRFVSPGVAIEDGTTMCMCADESSCMECRYTTVYVKTDGQWLVASVHDRDAHDLKEHSLKMGQLAWLQGEWVDEGEDAVVHFACEPTDSGNFLLRSFSIHVAGQETMTGTQRIGWDPLAGKLRTWVFDSSGSFGEGVWYRLSEADPLDADGVEIHDPPLESGDTKERWILKLSGVMADGKAASSTSIYTLVNDHTMTWQCVDHEVDGEPQPDSEVITIVRRAAEPGTAEADQNR